MSESKSICYLQYTNPAAYPPLEHSSRILADRGWKVLFVGCGASGEADCFRFVPHPRVRTVRWSFPTAGWWQKIHYSAFCLWVVWQVWVSGSRWIYASEALACPAALLASLLPGRRVIYHEHDSPSSTGMSSFMRCVLSSRVRLCQRAHRVIIPNTERAQVFQEIVQPACPIVVVWNCPRLNEVVSSERSPNQKIVLFYHGSLNPLRLPFTVLEALQMLPANVRLDFAGYTTVGHPNFIEEFRKEATRLKVVSRVGYLGAFSSREQLLSWTGRAHIGLALMPNASGDINMRAMTGASNKPFDYLATGLNLVVTDLPDWREMFVQPGYAQACDPANPESIATAVRWWLDHPAQAEAARARGRQRILEEWNYERQFGPVSELLDSLREE